MSEAPGMQEQLLAEFNAIVSETERLLTGQSTGTAVEAVPGAGLDERLTDNLRAARERLEQLEDSVLQRTKAAFKVTDTYVHEHPWQAVGIAAGIGLLIGLLLRRR
jgi:ElaB/YqjD/DUF883 family membrane-anchored ribosome-binding protein